MTPQGSIERAGSPAAEHTGGSVRQARARDTERRRVESERKACKAAQASASAQEHTVEAVRVVRERAPGTSGESTPRNVRARTRSNEPSADGGDTSTAAASSSAATNENLAEVTIDRTRMETLSQQRGKRKSTEGPTRGYDETRRRKARRVRNSTGYVEKGNRARTGGLKRGLEVGAVTVERVVHGRYEWRDGGMRPMTGARKAMWQ